MVHYVFAEARYRTRWAKTYLINSMIYENTDSHKEHETTFVL